MQIVALAAACAIGLAGEVVRGKTGGRGVFLIATLAGLALPLLADPERPARWIPLGFASVYAAPLLLPAFLVVCSAWMSLEKNRVRLAIVAVIGACVLLALQPDASQALALSIAALVMFVTARAAWRVAMPALVAMSAITAWAFTRPDPLEPVPHVEGVFALAFSHSVAAGVIVTLSAAVLVTGLHVYGSRWRIGLSAVAAYYAVLFGCSVAGLTPAPLMGFGAGPVLGFGVMVAAAASLRRGEQG